MPNLFAITIIAISFVSPVYSAKEFINHTRLMNHGDGHLMDMDGGMVMGQNTDTLPGGCDKIAATEEITVHAGHKYAKDFPGRMFAFDTQSYQFEPCTKLTVHFINDDNVRHQWMMHGLPKYLYPKGMFHLEVTGPGKISGTLIFPPNDKTYLVHCDISQHMEKGMKGQLKIGKGSGDLPSIPGITANVIQDDYSKSIPETVQNQQTQTVKVINDDTNITGIMLLGIFAGLFSASFLIRHFKDKSIAEILSIIVNMIIQTLAWVFQLLSAIILEKSVDRSDRL